MINHIEEPLTQDTGHVVTDIREDFWHASYFPELDGLRTLSLLLVIGYHVRTQLPIKHFFDGVVGVGFFFVISGFLITTILLRERRAKGTTSLRSFYTRRIFRIVPMYAVTLLLYLAVGLIPSQHVLGEKMLRALPYDLTLRNEYIPASLDVAFTHSWSLSVEEKFYLAWPLLFLLFTRKRHYPWAVVPLMIIPLLISHSSQLPVAYFSIMLGCATSLLLESLESESVGVANAIRRVPTILWLLLWLAAYFLSLNVPWRFTSAIATALLLAKLLVQNTWLSRLLGASVPQWIGKRTYSMYLLHAFCLSAVSRWIKPDSNVAYFEVLILTFLIALAAGSITYYLIEMPFIRIGRRLAGETRTASVAQTERHSSQSGQLEKRSA